MEKYYIENLYLEITRNCTLQCKHCYKGERRPINMPLDIIDKVFNEVGEIEYLLLTGGEVLMCENELERVLFNIRNNGIKVNYISIITNGTVLNLNIIKILKELSLYTNLQIYISADKFHMMEIERAGLMEKRNRNVEILKSLFDAKEWSYEEKDDLAIDKIGNAETLTLEDLERVNNWGGHKTNYSFKSAEETKQHQSHYPTAFVTKFNGVFRYVQVDALGNLSPIYYPYTEEDNLAYGTLNNKLSFINNLKLIKKN